MGCYVDMGTIIPSLNEDISENLSVSRFLIKLNVIFTQLTVA